MLNTKDQWQILLYIIMTHNPKHKQGVCYKMSAMFEERNEDKVKTAIVGDGIWALVLAYRNVSRTPWDGSGTPLGVHAPHLENHCSRGRPLGRWKYRIKEYLCKRDATRGGLLKQARRQCLDKERWSLFCHHHQLGKRFWRVIVPPSSQVTCTYLGTGKAMRWPIRHTYIPLSNLSYSPIFRKWPSRWCIVIDEIFESMVYAGHPSWQILRISFIFFVRTTQTSQRSKLSACVLKSLLFVWVFGKIWTQPQVFVKRWGKLIKEKN